MMKILDIYIARQFVSTYAFATVSFVALFILANLFEELGTFIDTGLGADKIIVYYLRTIPETVLLVSPVSTLLSSLYVTGKLSAASELSAMKASGVSLRQLITPFLLAAFAVTLLNILNAGFFSPYIAIERHRFEQEFFKRTFESLSGNNNLHILESRNRILSITSLDPEEETGYGISLETFDGPELKSRIDAKKITYDNMRNRWFFHETRTRVFTDDGVNYRENPGQDTLKLSIDGSSLRELGIQPDAMNIVQHLSYIREKQRAGFSNLGRVIVKFHNKMALPFASVIIVLIGVPLSARKRRSGFAIEFGISLLIGFSYLSVQRAFAIAGYRSVLDPLLAAWLPNLLFLFIGLYIYKTANR